MQKHLSQAATRLAEAWQHDRHLSQLEPDLQPKNRREAYAVQALIVDQINEPTIGWKIAATSEGGQRHINVSAPSGWTLIRLKGVAGWRIAQHKR